MAATLFATSSAAIMMTDARLRILAVNAAFTAMTGYSAEDALGHTPRLLASGRHDRAFYAALWSQLLATDHWEGVLWNRRKDGRLYLSHQCLSVISDREGRPTNFISIFTEPGGEAEASLAMRQHGCYDALTGLPNRALLWDRVNHAIPRALRDGGRLALLFIDLDGFKPVNDRFGHLAGDEVLREIARRLADCVREGDTLARFGGDEFVILLHDVGDVSVGSVVAERVLRRVALPLKTGGTTVELSASIGIAFFPVDGRDVATLIEKADAAMYAAKQAGGGDCRVAGSGTPTSARPACPS